MMLTKIKYSKIAIVVFLTLLIWIYADLALNEEFTVSSATIVVAKSDPSFWISFNGESSVSVGNILLKGPASKISDVRRKWKDGTLNLEFLLDAGQEGMVEPGEYPLDLLDFLRKSEQIRGFGLTVESCQPAKLTVNVVQLVQKLLTVRCVDESGDSYEAENIDPPDVKMFVPEDWGREKLIAEVTLTRGEIEKARSAPIPMTPQVVLGAGQVRDAVRTVRIKMPPEEDPLSEYTILATSYAIAYSPTLQDRFRAKITNIPQLLSPIVIRATSEAKRAYELQPLPLMTVYVLDGDEKQGQTEEGQRRKVVYNFPEEFVQSGQIELKNPQKPAEAKFILIPLPAAENR